jgi:hypothetical protein
VGTIVGYRAFAAQDLADDVDVLTRASEWLCKGLAVPTLDDLGARDSEPEAHAAAGEVVESEGVHGRRGGRARRELHDSRAEPDAFGVGGDPAERREGIRPPGLGGKDDLVAEPLGLLCDFDEAFVGLCLPVAELQSELHRISSSRVPVPSLLRGWQ